MSSSPGRRRGSRKISPPAKVIADSFRQPGTIVALLLAAAPLALIPGILISHDVIPKVVLILLGSATLLFLLPRWQSGISQLWSRPLTRAFLLLTTAQFATLAVSTLLSARMSLALAGTVWRRFGFVEQSAVLVVAVAAASIAAARPLWIPLLFRAAVAGGGAAAVYGVLQYFHLDPFLERKLYSIEYFGSVLRPPGTMGHALYFSTYLVVITCLAAAVAVRDTSVRWRRASVGIVAAASAAIVLSGTRSALLALLSAGILFAVRTLRSRIAASPLRFALGLAGVVITLAAFFAYPVSKDLRLRIGQWRTENGGPRLQMWSETPALIQSHVLAGTGPETFAAEFRKIESEKLSRTYPDFYQETPHNTFLDAASSQGVPGLLVLAGLFLVTLFPGGRGKPGDFVLRCGIESATAGLLISSMFASFTLVSFLFLWVLAGLHAVLNSEDVHLSASQLSIVRLPAIVAGAVFVVFAVSLAGQDAAWARLSSAVDAGKYAAAIDSFGTAKAFSLGMPGYELLASRRLAELGRSLGQTEAGARAWKLSREAAALAAERGEEPFSAAYQLSVLAVVAGDLAGAEKKARETIGLAPNWYKGHLLLSQLLDAAGKKDESAREAGISIELGWKK